MKRGFAKNCLKKVCLFFLLILVAVSPLSACGTSKNKTDTSTPSSTLSTSDGIVFPLSKPVTLTYWINLNGQSAKSLKSYDEMLLYKEMEKATGVHIEFKHPPLGQEADQFNIMIASRNLPDLVHSGWAVYPGGMEKANQDNVAIKLNDLIDKNSPNLKALLSKRSDVKKELMTDSGAIYYFPCVYEGPLLTVWYGPQVRKDWLDKLSLSVPQTIDEWYKVLKAFKEKDPNGNGKADEIPYVNIGLVGNDTGYAFIGAWNIRSTFYNDNGKVKFGALQPEFKEWITTMRKWYSEGLIDPDFAAIDSKGFSAKITGNLVGSYFGSCSGNLGKFMKALTAENPSYKLVGAPNPSLKKGDNNVFGSKSNSIDGGNGTAITSSNKNQAISAKWLDYLYSKEGNNLVNFGVEGITYKMVNGKPAYTDDILKNTAGLSVGEALSKYTHVTVGGPFVENELFWSQLLSYPEQTAAIAEWSKAENRRWMPAVTLTPDESKQVANIMNEINTYMSEMVIKIVMGQEQLEKYDNFINTLKSMKIDQAITIEQNALDRFLKRN